MKAILEFSLPKDEEAHKVAVNSMDLAIFRHEVYQIFRQVLKYEELKPEQTDIVVRLLNDIRAIDDIPFELT